jgi:hypothetical protein
MPARPIFDQNEPGGSEPVPSNLPSPRGGQQDSTLASQLPDWDLLPAHSLLVRRRLGALSKPASRPESPPLPPPVPAAPPASSTARVAPPALRHLTGSVRTVDRN